MENVDWLFGLNMFLTCIKCIMTDLKLELLWHMTLVIGDQGGGTKEGEKLRFFDDAVWDAFVSGAYLHLSFSFETALDHLQ